MDTGNHGLTSGRQAAGIEEIHLHPGEVFCARHAVIRTLLGSCVAVCLRDEHSGVIGMNHVMLPVCRQEDNASTKFANVATYVLYDLMRENGARPKRMTARVFGGANGLSKAGLQAGLAVGGRNLEVTRGVLDKLGIPITAEDVGGSHGRKIVFDSRTGRIQMVYLRKFNFVDEREIVVAGSRRHELW